MKWLISGEYEVDLEPQVDQVVLTKVAPGVFELPECKPGWIGLALAGCEIDRDKATFVDTGSFVGKFVVDAENYWTEKRVGIERSELFSVDDDSEENEHFFELMAAWAGKRPCLIIEHITCASDQSHLYIRNARRAASKLRRAASERIGPFPNTDPIPVVLRPLPDIMLRFDVDNRLASVRPGQDFGCTSSPDVALGQSVDQILPPEVANELKTRRSAVLNGTAFDVFEYQVQRGAEIRNYEIRLTGAVNEDVVVAIRDTSEQALVESQMRLIAFTDSLTGLANRRLLQDRIDGAIRRAERDDSLVSVLLVDLNGFKLLNDAYGHLEGDRALRIAANRIRSTLRGADTAARWGGDEFVVVAEGTKRASDAVTIATKLVERVGEPFAIGGDIIRMSASVGIALYPTHGSISAELFEAADEAMYRLKKQGSGSVAFASPKSPR